MRELADRAFMAIATAEGEIHGMPPEEVHLHEVGAVDAILDVVGVIWGLELLGVERVYCGTIALGDGTVRAAHGLLPVPAPATLKLLEGHPVKPGPEGSGELVTPTGAALVRVLSSGPPPAEYVPLRSGFGAGTKDFRGRANALRVILADERVGGGCASRSLIELVCEIDDMSAEYLAAVGRSRACRRRARRDARVRDDEAGAAGHAGRGALSARRRRRDSRNCCSPRRRRSVCGGARFGGGRCRARVIATHRPWLTRSRPSSSRCRTAAGGRSRSSSMSNALHWRQDGLCRIFLDWPSPRRNAIPRPSVGNPGPTGRVFLS